MRKTSLASLLFLLGFFPSLAFADATSTSFIVESEQAVAGGGRQSSDSFTNIGTVGGGMIATRATSTSFTADVSTAFWNAAHTGTLTVTDTSDVTATAAFTLSYASADPESPLFMACYGTVQADVESSCTGAATRALTDAFTYRFSGLTNNTTYYFRVYPLSGYDDSANPIISPYYSETVSASRTSSSSGGDIFTPVSGGSGSGSSAGGGGGTVQSASEVSPASVGIVGRVMAFLGFSSPAPVAVPAVENRVVGMPRPVAIQYIVRSVAGLQEKDSPAVGEVPAVASEKTFPVLQPMLLPVRGVVLDSATKAGISGARATVYTCPSPAARLTGCSVWSGSVNPLTADSRGQFIFSAPSGIYRMRAEARGYEVGESDSLVLAEVGQSFRAQLQKKSLWRRIFGLW